MRINDNEVGLLPREFSELPNHELRSRRRVSWRRTVDARLLASKEYDEDDLMTFSNVYPSISRTRQLTSRVGEFNIASAGTFVRGLARSIPSFVARRISSHYSIRNCRRKRAIRRKDQRATTLPPSILPPSHPPTRQPSPSGAERDDDVGKQNT